MLTIKLYLSENGSVADLHKDFPLFQGQYQNVLLNAFVPVSLLSPNFTVNSVNTDEITLPFVAGTAVKIGMRTIARNGSYSLSGTYYMQFVKTLVKDNINYALFERKMPKEFSYYAGQGINAATLIINVENIAYGEITSATAESSNEDLTVSVNISQVSANLPALSKNYVFTYEESTTLWYSDGNAIDLITYGITVSGTPQDQDTITLSVIAENPTVISILTTQEVKLDIMPSSNFGDQSMDADDYNTIMSLINAINGILTDKQDKVDNSLMTTQKTVVGAINELLQRVVNGEDYIGTYNYLASSVSDLPTDSDLLAFARTQRGEDYQLKGGDTIIVVQMFYTATDRNYKYIYNGTSWSYYEIPSIQLAINGAAGIVAGTYGVGKTYNTLVSIENGEIVAIYVKNEYGNYVDLTTAYMPLNVGASKQYVKDYALPREFNDVLYLGDGYYQKTIPDTPASGVQYEIVSAQIGNQEVFECRYPSPTDVAMPTFQLASKNSYIANFYIGLAENTEITARFLLTTSIIKGGTFEQTILSAELSDEITLTDTPQKVAFESAFTNLAESVITFEEDDTLAQTLEIVRTDSASATIQVYCNEALPSKFYLFTGVAALINANVVQEMGQSTTDVMSQKAVSDLFNNLPINYATDSDIDAMFLSTPTQGLDFVLSQDGTYYSVQGKGTATTKNIIVPQSYNNKPVKRIATSAFSQSDIESIIIPTTCEVVHAYAFNKCDNLNAITFMHSENEPLEISEFAFETLTPRNMIVYHYGNAAITNYNFGENITTTLIDLR